MMLFWDCGGYRCCCLYRSMMVKSWRNKGSHTMRYLMLLLGGKGGEGGSRFSPLTSLTRRWLRGGEAGDSEG